MQRIRSLIALLGRRAAPLLPLALGAGLLALLVSRREGPRMEPPAEAARPLRVIEAPVTTLVPRTVAYGAARAADVWSAVAEVRGRLVKVDPDLRSGMIVPQGREILQIDPTDYRLQIALLDAEIAQTAAQLAELDVQAENLTASLEIERESLRIAELDLERLRQLRTTDSVTEAEYERTQREALAQRQSVQTLVGSLNALPAQREALISLRGAREAKRDLARIDEERCTLRAPFVCRIGAVNLELGQYVAAGQKLFDAYGMATAEVEALASFEQVRQLVQGPGQPLDLSKDVRTQMQEAFRVAATVRMHAGDEALEWPARFDRVREEIDLQTRTVRFVVAVDEPYADVVPGRRPPLAPGMFCEVELRGEPRPNCLVIPRVALHDGHVYLVDRDNRLQRRRVEVDYAQGAIVSVTAGVAPGERVVISDPTPAIAGMLVEPLVDAEAHAQCLRDAAGEGSVR